MGWFDVDRNGLSKLLAKRGKAFVLYELWSNGADSDATRVDITLREARPSRQGMYDLIVSDDDPNGFSNLSHAYTLFAESSRKADASKRGRFNLGEKVALAMCEYAEISTTTGTVCFAFDSDGREIRKTTRETTVTGSRFTARIRLSHDEYDEVADSVKMLIPSIPTSFNGQVIEPHELVADFVESLPTVAAREDGSMFNTTRKCKVEVYEPKPGETAHIYELGVPVVGTADRYHVNVLQKIPLNMDRDNVPPHYLRVLRTLVFNSTSDLLTKDQATTSWVQEATSDPRCDRAAFDQMMDNRFGNKRVSFDLSDPEANALAVTSGHTVIHGGSLSAGQWDNAKQFGAVLPAGKVTPSPKPFSTDGSPIRLSANPPNTGAVANIAQALLGKCVEIKVADDARWDFTASYSRGDVLPPILTVNLRRVGRKWFDLSDIEATMDLLIHELAHEFESNHLSESYYHALTKLAGKAVALALFRPAELFAMGMDLR